MKSTHHYILAMLRVTPEMGIGSITARLRENHAITLPQAHVQWILDQMLQRGEIGTLDRRKGTNETFTGYFVAPMSHLQSALIQAQKRRDKAVLEYRRADRAVKRLQKQQDAIYVAVAKVELQAAWVEAADTRSVLGVGV